MGDLLGSQIAPGAQGFGWHGFFFSTQPRIVFGLSRYPGKQVHLAKPLLSMAHWVLGPQGEGSQGCVGSVQALDGGLPSYSGKQKHCGASCTRRQPELAPHGFGTHSSPSGTVK